MSFLSGKSIKNLIEQNDIFLDEYNLRSEKLPEVKHNYCKLTVGPEAFITSDIEVKKPKLIKLRETGEVYVDPGQFGILTTEEIIAMPTSLMGFISVDTDFKYKGLINVSGFHINPGWKGRLIFTVYNAGPHPIELRYLEPAFLVWFTELDSNEEVVSQISSYKPNQATIDSDKINDINGHIFSPHALAQRIRQLELVDQKKYLFVGWAFLIGILMGLGIDFFVSLFGKFIGPNAAMKEEMMTKIKDEIVDEALKQIQEYNQIPPKKGGEVPAPTNQSPGNKPSNSSP